MKKLLFIATALFLIISSVAGFAAEDQLAREIELGKHFDEKELDQKLILWDMPTMERISKIGFSLTAKCKRDISYTFRLLEAKEQGSYMAFSVPGGYVYIGKDLCDCLTDDELAGVLAHEVEHCDLAHGIREMDEARRSNKLTKILDVFTKGWASVIASVPYLSHSREKEAEADAAGMALMKEAGFNPIGYAGLMAFLASKEKDAPPSFLSTHPETSKRYKKAYDATAKVILDEAVKRYKWPLDKLYVAINIEGKMSSLLEPKRANIQAIVSEMIKGCKVEFVADTATVTDTSCPRIALIFNAGEAPSGTINIMSRRKVWDAVTGSEQTSSQVASWVEPKVADFDKKLISELKSSIVELLGDTAKTISQAQVGIVVRSGVTTTDRYNPTVEWVSKPAAADFRCRYTVIRDGQPLRQISYGNGYLTGDRETLIKAGDVFYPAL